MGKQIGSLNSAITCVCTYHNTGEVKLGKNLLQYDTVIIIMGRYFGKKLSVTVCQIHQYNYEPIACGICDLSDSNIFIMLHKSKLLFPFTLKLTYSIYWLFGKPLMCW